MLPFAPQKRKTAPGKPAVATRKTAPANKGKAAGKKAAALRQVELSSGFVKESSHESHIPLHVLQE